MRLERTKNATKNIVFGAILRIYQIVVPFIMRTVMIYLLGIEYVGLNGLFTSILQVLNLAELGMGAAMVFSMYKPIAEDDEETISALMNLYKKYYRIIGTVILIAGIGICPFIPKLIKNGVPSDINVYVLYILNLMTTVLSYWLFAYKNCLLQAHQRTDIVSKITLIVNTVQYIVQFILLFLFRNYYLYVIAILVSQIITNTITAITVNKMYPKYKAYGKLSTNSIKEINSRVKDLFTAKVGSVVANSADTIVISSFLGLATLAIYQNYYYVLTALIGIVGVIFNSCTAGIGNSIVMESKEKNYKDLKKFTFIIAWLAGFCVCALICLYQAFMKIWVGDGLLFEFPAVICFAAYYFVYEINALLTLYKDSAGIWHKDRFRPLITAIINLILNLVLVNFIGIYGVLLSTVISTTIIGLPWIIHNLFSELFRIDVREYILKLLKYTISTIIVAVITFLAINLIKDVSIFSFILKAILCFTISNALFYILYRNCEEMRETKILLKKIIKK